MEVESPTVANGLKRSDHNGAVNGEKVDLHDDIVGGHSSTADKEDVAETIPVNGAGQEEWNVESEQAMAGAEDEGRERKTPKRRASTRGTGGKFVKGGNGSVPPDKNPNGRTGTRGARGQFAKADKSPAITNGHRRSSGDEIVVQPRPVVADAPTPKRVSRGRRSSQKLRDDSADVAGSVGEEEQSSKLTFEDQIKQLEEEARQQADGSEGARSASRRVRRVPRKLQLGDEGSRQASPTPSTPREGRVTPSASAKPAGSRRKSAKVVIAVADEEEHVLENDHAEPSHIVLHEDEDTEMADAIDVLPQEQEIEEEIEEVVAVKPKRITFAENIKDHSFNTSEFEAIQYAVLEKLTGKRRPKLIGLDEEFAKVATLINQTIVAGESNSMLLIGARGSGKTAVVDHILHDQAAKQGQDFLAVRLSGFIHTDDKIALREIWRQLGKEMEVEEDSLAKNYADTLTTLLALLSHPSEIAGQETDQVTKSVIFILDEFDLFATHPRQTLLYNLFDIAQSRKAPIAVLGLTTRFDVAESLEKRVKSRFSHRYVHLSLAKNFSVFQEMCKSSLMLEAKDLLGTDEHLTLDTSLKLSSNGDTTTQEALSGWNTAMNHLFSTNDAFSTHLRKLYYSTKSVVAFQTSMLIHISSIPLSSTGGTTTSLILPHLISSIPNLSSALGPDSKLALLPSLSDLQLSLLIAAARLPIIHDTDTCTFALAYDEYKSLASKARIQASASGAMASGTGSRVWGKDVVKGAWEGLIELELVMPAAEGRGSRDGGICRVDVGLEEIGMSGVEMSSVLAKWCREI